jgi:hypothetical protein
MRLIAFSLLTLVTTSAVQSQILISNLPGNDGTSTFMNAPSGGSNGGGVHDSKAAGFTLPAGLDYTLDEVQLRLNFFNLDSDPVVAIYDNNVQNNPGNLLTTLSNPSLAVGAGTFSFTPISTFTLNDATTYWVVVSNAATVANSFQWFASSPSMTPTGIATSAGYRFSNGPPPPVGSSTTLNSYAVLATVVPEPGSIILIGLVAVGLTCRRRSRSG